MQTINSILLAFSVLCLIWIKAMSTRNISYPFVVRCHLSNISHTLWWNISVPQGPGTSAEGNTIYTRRIMSNSTGNLAVITVKNTSNWSYLGKVTSFGFWEFILLRLGKYSVSPNTASLLLHVMRPNWSIIFKLSEVLEIYGNFLRKKGF